ncbi:MAG: glycosyltransferase family 39 protein [Polyangiaceae bacterium]
MTAQTSPSLKARLVAVAVEPLTALALGAGYVALLLMTSHSLGYARDEGFYFQAARSYQAWFELLLQSPEQAMTRPNVDRFWAANHEHPALIKSLFALSHYYLFQKHKILATAGDAFRFPGMVLSGVAVGVTYLWGARAVSRGAGVVAAVLLAMMPRVFYHAHLDCFDMPVAAMWLLTTYAFWRSLERGTLFALFVGVLYGLLLNTKHNSWLLPPALLGWLFIVKGRSLWRGLKVGKVRIPTALFAMGLVGPLVFYAMWPWIWHDTGKRLGDYVAFHMHHEYYNMEFLGRTYWKPPMSLAYAWLMTLGTVPAVTLALFLTGLVGSLGLYVRTHLRRPWQWLLARVGRVVELSRMTRADRSRISTDVMWLLCILTSYAPWLSKGTPIFGGTKHWITAYPFLCLFAARGFFALVQAAQRKLPRASAAGGGIPLRTGLMMSVVAAPIVTTLQSHPWGLSAYTPLVGGASGAATLGLNRTFWGYTTGAVAPYLNEHVPPGTGVYVHDTAMQSWEQMVQDGMLDHVRGSWTIESSGFSVYHYEPHMGRVEYQIWVDYGTTSPVHVGTHDGVPVIWVYKRP